MTDQERGQQKQHEDTQMAGEAERDEAKLGSYASQSSALMLPLLLLSVGHYF